MAKAPLSHDGLFLDVNNPTSRNDLAFLGRVGFPPIIVAQVMDLETDPRPRVRAALPPPLVPGTRNELLRGTDLLPVSPPSGHYSETLGPAQVPAKTTLNLMHLGNVAPQASDELAHLQHVVSNSLNKMRDLEPPPPPSRARSPCIA